MIIPPYLWYLLSLGGSPNGKGTQHAGYKHREVTAPLPKLVSSNCRPFEHWTSPCGRSLVKVLNFFLPFSKAFKEGMYGEHYVWILLDWYDNKQWWLINDNQVDCTPEQMDKAVKGYFSIESARIVSSNAPTLSGLVSHYVGKTMVISHFYDACEVITFSIGCCIWWIGSSTNSLIYSSCCVSDMTTIGCLYIHRI